MRDTQGYRRMRGARLNFNLIFVVAFPCRRSGCCCLFVCSLRAINWTCSRLRLLTAGRQGAVVGSRRGPAGGAFATKESFCCGWVDEHLSRTQSTPRTRLRRLVCYAFRNLTKTNTTAKTSETDRAAHKDTQGHALATSCSLLPFPFRYMKCFRDLCWLCSELA